MKNALVFVRPINKLNLNFKIPHVVRVTRLYRQWLKLALLFPRSFLVEMNDHKQMNERALIVIRQRFQEGKEIKDRKRIRVLLNEAERSLTMLRELSQDSAQRRFPQERKPPDLFHLPSLWGVVKQNFKLYVREWVNCFLKRKW